MLCKQRGDDQIDALKCKEASHLKRSAKVESAFTFTIKVIRERPSMTSSRGASHWSGEI